MLTTQALDINGFCYISGRKKIQTEAGYILRNSDQSSNCHVLTWLSLGMLYTKFTEYEGQKNLIFINLDLSEVIWVLNMLPNMLTV